MGRLCCSGAHCAKSLIIVPFPTDHRRAPRGFYLAIARSVAFAAPSLRHGCDMLRPLRWTCTPIIAVREAMTLAQIGAPSVPWWSIDAHSKGEMTAIALQLDGHWMGRWIGFWIAAGSTGTSGLSSCARVLRVQSQTQEEIIQRR